MKAILADDEGLCCMACWKMCLFDRNGDMCLDMGEFKCMMEAMSKMQGKEFDEDVCKEKWKMADADGDGKVNMNELKAFLKKCCEKM